MIRHPAVALAAAIAFWSACAQAQTLDQYVSSGGLPASAESAPERLTLGSQLESDMQAVGQLTLKDNLEHGLCINRAGAEEQAGELHKQLAALIGLYDHGGSEAEIKAARARADALSELLQKPAALSSTPVQGEEDQIRLDCKSPFLLLDLHTHPNGGAAMPSSADFVVGTGKFGEYGFLVWTPSQNGGALVLGTGESRTANLGEIWMSDHFHVATAMATAYVALPELSHAQAEHVWEDIILITVCDSYRLACYKRFAGSGEYVKLTPDFVQSDIDRTMAPDLQRHASFMVRLMEHWEKSIGTADVNQTTGFSDAILSVRDLIAAAKTAHFWKEGELASVRRTLDYRNASILMFTPSRNTMPMWESLAESTAGKTFATIGFGYGAPGDTLDSCVRFGTLVTPDGPKTSESGDDWVIDVTAGEYTGACWSWKTGARVDFHISIANGMLTTTIPSAPWSQTVPLASLCTRESKQPCSQPAWPVAGRIPKP